MAQGTFGGGNGLINDPYLIEDIADLNQIRVNPHLHYKLKYSINAGVAPYNEGNGWTPISNFSGTLDGNGKKIFNLFINRPNEDNVGLFDKFLEFSDATYAPEGYFTGAKSITRGKTVYDIGLENVNVTGRNNVGALVGLFSSYYNQGATSYYFNYPITRVFTNGKVKGSSAVAGLIGYATFRSYYSYGWTSTVYNAIVHNLIKDIYVNCEIIASNANTNYAGVIGRLRAIPGANTGYSNNNTITTSVGALGSNIVSNSRFSSTINGLVTHPLIAHNDGTLPSSLPNSFYNYEAWGAGSNNQATALTTEQMKRSTYLGAIVEQVNDFDESQRTWTFERGRYPQLYFAIADNLFIKADENYYGLDDNGNLELKFTMLPSREEAVEKGIKDISQVSNSIWNLLKEQYETVELVNIVERASNVQNVVTTHALDLDNTNGYEDKLVYRKEFKFSDFNDGISLIRTV